MKTPRARTVTAATVIAGFYGVATFALTASGGAPDAAVAQANPCTSATVTAPGSTVTQPGTTVTQPGTTVTQPGTTSTATTPVTTTITSTPPPVTTTITNTATVTSTDTVTAPPPTTQTTVTSTDTVFTTTTSTATAFTTTTTTNTATVVVTTTTSATATRRRAVAHADVCVPVTDGPKVISARLLKGKLAVGSQPTLLVYARPADGRLKVTSPRGNGGATVAPGIGVVRLSRKLTAKPGKVSVTVAATSNGETSQPVALELTVRAKR